MTNFLPVDSLDFDQLKANLKTYLQNQTQFKDYDFEGSNLSALLNLLSYNSYLNAFYLNMVGNEMFLDTAVLRDSVISRAKELNYTPRSTQSAVASVRVQVDVTNNFINTVTIPRFQTFSASVSNTTYTFSTADNITITRDANNNFIADVNIYEGFVVSERLIVDTANTEQRFILSNPGIDTSSLFVTVSSTGTSNDAVVYTKAASLYGLDSTSNVYFVQAADSGKYELLFGDNQFGRALVTGNAIRAKYRISNAEAPNGANAFSISSSIDGYNTTVTTLSPAAGGSVAETIDQIKFNAPRAYEAQNRAVTANDYSAILRSEFPYCTSVSVYGGEEVENAPQYGKVFISCTTNNDRLLTEAQKSDIQSFIRERSILNIETEIVNPEYTYIVTDFDVRFNPDRSLLTSQQIETQIRTTVANFNTANLKQFGKNFYSSKLSKAVDNIDPSIVATNIHYYVYKKIVPTIFQTQSFTIDYGNPIITNTDHHKFDINNILPFQSTFFTYRAYTDAYFGCDSAGRIFIYRDQASGRTLLNENSVGSVDFATGLVRISSVQIDGYQGDYIQMIAVPDPHNFLTKKNNVLIIDEQSTIITIESE